MPTGDLTYIDLAHVLVAQACQERVIDVREVTGGHGPPPLCEWL